MRAKRWCVCCLLWLVTTGCVRWNKLTIEQLESRWKVAKQLRVRTRKGKEVQSVVLKPSHFEDPFLEGHRIEKANRKGGQKHPNKPKKVRIDLRGALSIEELIRAPKQTTQLVLTIVLGAGFAAAMVAGLVLEIQKIQPK